MLLIDASAKTSFHKHSDKVIEFKGEYAGRDSDMEPSFAPLL